MTSIGASTTHAIKVKKKAGASVPVGRSKKSVASKLKAGGGRRGAVPPPLTASTLKTPEAIKTLCQSDEAAQRELVSELVRRAFGEQPLVNRSTPHTASSTRDRGAAAADVAVAAKELGLIFVLKRCGVMDQMKRMLFPDGLGALFSRTEEMTLRPSASSVSLASMDDVTVSSVGTDSKRGKSTPAVAREGSLLMVRAFCEGLGQLVEPFVVGGFLAAALDECGSASSAVREAAEDASSVLVALAHPRALPSLICPVLMQSLHSTEWRVKYNSLERLAQCARTEPTQMCSLLPDLIPPVTSQVWDTKPQVTKAAGVTLLAICQTNQNPDVAPAIPAVVKAICKPSQTVAAIQELMATTFVAPVDAPTLSILCPVLSRGLKEKLAINKRAVCIVISNMSRLVDSPQAVAPFGPLLVPELQKVAHNVQFEEIRDAALSALSNLTKALGESFKNVDEADLMSRENARVEEEQQRIAEEREVEVKREQEKKKKEDDERKRFKEAMDAQRELDKLEAKEEEEKKAQDLKKVERQKRSTKGVGGKCQGCGLRKCKKSCLFYS